MKQRIRAGSCVCFKSIFDRPVPMEMVSDASDQSSDGRLVLVPATGHAPGPIGACIARDRSGRFGMAFDAASRRSSLDRLVAVCRPWYPGGLAYSVEEVRRPGERCTTIACRHDLQEWATLRKRAHAND